MDYAIVIATRNRIDALTVSMPLFQAQTHSPRRIIVVDSSDDHAPVVELCRRHDGVNGVTVATLVVERANLPSQRNLGLELVDEPVVAMPDDDSLWFPDTAAQLLSIYEMDHHGLIGGVTASEVQVSPRLTAMPLLPRAARLTQRPVIARTRNRIEDALFPHPFNIYARTRMALLIEGAPEAGLNYKFVETMGGFRMSFKTNILRAIGGFDEVLGSRFGYAQHEDKDASLRVLKNGFLLAAAPSARVFHNTHPARRAGGFAYGFFHVFNYAYICGRNMEVPEARNAVERYLGYKLFLYSLRRFDDYGREVFRGARAAFGHVHQILRVKSDALPALYEALTARHPELLRTALT